MTSCLSRDRLAVFLSGQFANDQYEALERHLGECRACIDLLEQVERDSRSGFEEEIRRCTRQITDPLLCEVLNETQFVLSSNRGGLEHVYPSSEQPFVSLPVLHSLTLPCRFGKYTLHSVLGRGGMGIVYEATQSSLSRVVAVKILASIHINARIRFEQEGKAIAKLLHPSIVGIYEFGEEAGLLYYSMELMEGGTLSKRLSNGLLSEKEAVALMLKLAVAVSHCHTHGVAHRDLKPSNVLFDAHGTPKIADFGLAKFLNDDTSGITHGDAIMGTPPYMAPEQIDSSVGQVDERTDVYALGAIFYELLTGHAPFRESSKIKILNSVLKLDPSPPRLHRPDIPQALEAICLRCLEKIPRNRYQSVSELNEDLFHWLQGRQVPIKHRQKKVRMLRVYVFGSILIFAVLGAVVITKRSSNDQENLAKEIREGIQTRLFLPSGIPKYHEIKYGQEKSRTYVAPDGAFGLTCRNMTLLELAPAPKLRKFRYKIELRHEDSDPANLVGAYCAYRHTNFGDHSDKSFVALTYGDIHSESDHRSTGANYNIPAMYNASLIAPLSGHTREHLCNFASGTPFKIGGMGNQTWRTVELVVDMDSVSGFLDGNASGTIDRKLFMSQFDLLHDHEGFIEQDWKNPFAGSLGVILLNGSVAMRSATIESIIDR